MEGGQHRLDVFPFSVPVKSLAWAFCTICKQDSCRWQIPTQSALPWSSREGIKAWRINIVLIERDIKGLPADTKCSQIKAFVLQPCGSRMLFMMKLVGTHRFIGDHTAVTLFNRVVTEWSTACNKSPVQLTALKNLSWRSNKPPHNMLHVILTILYNYWHT